MPQPSPGSALLSSLLFVAPLAAQSAWTKAPPPPTACYSREDTFLRDAEAARTELEAEIERQEQTNKGIMDQVAKMDQATLQQRMMAAVQRDPARSGEILQALQSPAGPQGRPAVAANGEDEFRARKAKLEADYRAESNRVWGPLMSAARNNAETRAALVEFSRQYQTVLCPRWFRDEATRLAAAYRAYLTEQRIPPVAEAERTSMRMPELLGVSTREFRPVAEMKAVVDYLRFVSDLFVHREPEPRTAP